MGLHGVRRRGLLPQRAAKPRSWRRTPSAASPMSTIPGGDGMMRDCVYAHSRAHLTVLEGLYQHDYKHDASGFYESGVRPVSLHHWKSWYHEPIPKMATAANLCGDCFLQRYRFDNNFLVANGYSITQYPEGPGQNRPEPGGRQVAARRPRV